MLIQRTGGARQHFLPGSGIRVQSGGGGGAAAWSPASPTGDGGVLPHTWLRANAGLYQDDAGVTPADEIADPVGRREDQSGNGNHAIQATVNNKPTLQSGPVITYDGSDALRTGVLHAALSQPYTIFVKWSRTSSGTGVENVTGGASASEAQIRSFNNQVEVLAITALGYTKIPPFGPIITTAVFNGANSQIYEDGTLKNSGNAGVAGLTVLTVGGRQGPADRPLNGSEAEVVIYDGVLSTADREQVEGYLANL